ncbi:cation diffusion facilitator family transporter [Azospirillum halopraeferens]|uniref:cation diffusion facilitator family transporter n=1 Tax=Azospirillum halopraeferens TaxID=34010 RepID=UPI00040A2CA8|nr:cation diffusion facilitator family transporter [Azospirillum halopraeferens]
MGGGHTHGGHSHGDHSHGGHSHSGHSHGGHAAPVTAGSERRVFQVMLLTGAFMLAEVAGGVISGSLALLADAGHMLTDFAALALAWTAFRMGRRPADALRSYGWFRFEVLAAFVNGLALFVIAGWIMVEAAARLMEPSPVLAGPMLAVAVLGLLVNAVALWVLHRSGGGDNLNVRGAALHVLGDLLGSVGAIAAALIILWTGWTPIDPLLSVVVALLVLRSALSLVRESAHILLEGTPPGIDAARVGAAVRAVPGVVDVHHVHAWALTGERPLMTLHAVVEDAADSDTVLAAVSGVLRDRFGVVHATIQIERGACPHGTALCG